MQNPIRHGVLALLVGTALGLAQPSLAQKLPQQANPQTSPQPAAEGEAPFTISVNFPGGSVEQYIVALQKSAGEKPVNVVVPAEAKKVILPPITLRNVTVITALSAIQAAFDTGSEHAFSVGAIGSRGDATYAIEYAHVDPATRPMSNGRPSTKPTKRLEVYTIRDLIDPPAGTDGPVAKVSYENILAAVDAAMQLLDVEDAPKILFHKETGLLMVGGTQYQTEVVDNVIRRVREDLQRRWNEDKTSRKQSSEQARRQAIAQSEIQLAEQEVNVAVERYERVKKLVEAGNASRDELSEAQLGMLRAKTMLDRKKAEFEQSSESNDGAKAVVVYDIADLVARDPNIADTVALLVKNSGMQVNMQKDNKSLIISGDDKAQQSVKSVLETLRKVAGSTSGAKPK